MILTCEGDGECRGVGSSLGPTGEQERHMEEVVFLITFFIIVVFVIVNFVIVTFVIVTFVIVTFFIGTFVIVWSSST